MRSVTAYRSGRLRRCIVAFAACVLGGIVAADASERGFPYNSELIMDAKPMRGSKRVPMLVIGAKGEAKIEGWCNNVEAQMVVAADTLTILTGASTEQQCPADRMRRVSLENYPRDIAVASMVSGAAYSNPCSLAGLSTSTARRAFSSGRKR